MRLSSVARAALFALALFAGSSAAKADEGLVTLVIFKAGWFVGGSAGQGVLTFHVATLYPLLYRMEERGWIVGRWVEKAGERRRRFYRLTPAGRAALATQRQSWKAFVSAINRVAGVRYV